MRADLASLCSTLSFIFIADTSSTFSLQNNIVRPYRFSVYLHSYQLHAVIHSRVRGGNYFKTTAILQKNGSKFMACLDNIKRPDIQFLTEDENEFEEHIQKIRYPLTLCYKHTHDRHIKAIICRGADTTVFCMM